jgi:multidrug resistance efflux pump
VDIRTVNMSFRVGGRLAALTVDEGDAITAGQRLGQLDKAPFENALMQAKAGVSVAQAQYDLMLAGYRDEEVAQAAAAVKQAQAAYDYAQKFYQRQQGLWGSRTISANDLENARSSRDQAQATLKSAQDKLSQYRTGNRPQDIAQAKASLEQAQVSTSGISRNACSNATPSGAPVAPVIPTINLIRHLNFVRIRTLCSQYSRLTTLTRSFVHDHTNRQKQTR